MVISRHFLSRLCGGEAIVRWSDPPLDFLSRLCGGEVGGVNPPPFSYFLSRLCGGEAATSALPLASLFLSRLCGGEEGVVVSKSVKAGDVSSSKTYASGTDGEPISQAEQQALLLLAAYLVKTKGYRQVRVERA